MITTDFFTQYPVSINFKINSFKVDGYSAIAPELEFVITGCF